MSVTLEGCVDWDDGGKIKFVHSTECFGSSYTGCIIWTGEHAGQVKISIDNANCNDDYYGCIDWTTGLFKILVPDICVRPWCNVEISGITDQNCCEWVTGVYCYSAGYAAFANYSWEKVPPTDCDCLNADRFTPNDTELEPRCFVLCTIYSGPPLYKTCPESCLPCATSNAQRRLHVVVNWDAEPKTVQVTEYMKFELSGSYYPVFVGTANLSFTNPTIVNNTNSTDYCGYFVNCTGQAAVSFYNYAEIT